MKPEIRPMSKRDKSAVMRFLRKTPEFSKLDVQVAEEVIDSYLSSPEASDYFAFVAEFQRDVVGFISFGSTPLTRGTWDVYWIAVAPDMKGKGIGTALLSFTEDKIKASGGYLILIETSGTDNYADTRRFYLSRGYREAFRVRDFYAPGDDLVTMEKRFQ